MAPQHRWTLGQIRATPIRTKTSLPPAAAAGSSNLPLCALIWLPRGRPGKLLTATADRATAHRWADLAPAFRKALSCLCLLLGFPLKLPASPLRYPEGLFISLEVRRRIRCSRNEETKLVIRSTRTLPKVVASPPFPSGNSARQNSTQLTISCCSPTEPLAHTIAG